jgi:ribokinase
MMMTLNFPPDCLHYRAMIGVGGIGSGTFFALRGNATLGREESRAGRFLDRRDYCKLHIISHYVAVLMGPAFSTIPVGKIGDDGPGKQVLAEMKTAGLDTRFVAITAEAPTMYSICFVYPDGCGGNLTSDDSASARVDAAFVELSRAEFIRFEGRGIALSAPEAPMDARAQLLKLGTAHRFFRTASFTSSEIKSALQSALLDEIDLLALNRDESAALLEHSAEKTSAEDLARETVKRLHDLYPSLQLSITGGREGSWSWDGMRLQHLPAITVPVECTAGAGDAHLSGILSGLAIGLPLAEAQQLGTLLAAVSVTSPHTIHPDTSRSVLSKLSQDAPFALSSRIQRLLEES